MKVSHYQEWYLKDLEKHVMFKLQEIKGTGFIAQQLIRNAGDAKEAERVAEYFLDTMHFDAENYRKFRKKDGKSDIRVDSLISDEIAHVHHACAEEIRKKWTKPLMTEEEVNEYFAKKEIEPELEESLKDVGKDWNVDVLL